ncbi:CBASS cGAMP-activated phospholipase [Paraburkholderia nemoris]|uniref:CGAMP-activated phospholipase n=1 Tax=Paraburkholderia nemoris TaxID=2793076 RepID=A0ABN7LJH7_9BURK|nr:MULTISPECIES: CBASS cGAMP-activated phospholipase [Paraburkholderia]MBK3812779.1 patatin-like phospholipase family protein [Paraburkholderia aspalathi]CAE6754046.1 cGAMP-activated phospholipase [Paraburkholderia nemoris]CAE6808166.1 cGAMP-activated phospholipase [Paraburkholderia nemoris]
MSESKPYRVLSLDGGGVRGLYTAVLLAELSRRFAAQDGTAGGDFDLGKQFDMIVGTSTGAILAVALAAGVSLSEVARLFRDKAPGIFQHPVPEGGLGLVSWIYRHLRKPANSPEALRAALAEVLKDETVAEMFQRRGIALCIPTVNVETNKAWVFKTPHDRKENRLHRDDNYKLVDVCMASAAAPIVFPLKCVEKPGDKAQVNWFTDGGLWANNPSLVALTEALTMAESERPIELMAASTCPPFKGRTLRGHDSSRGLLGWKVGLGIVEVALDAQSFAYHYVTQAVADTANRPVRYVRLQDPDVPTDQAKHLSLDNPSPQTLELLTKLAHDAADLNISAATAQKNPTQPLIREFFRGIQPLIALNATDTENNNGER